MSIATEWLPGPVKSSVGAVVAAAAIVAAFLAFQGWVDSRAEAAVQPVREELTKHKDTEAATLERLGQKLDQVNDKLQKLGTDVEVIKATVRPSASKTLAGGYQ